MSPIDANTLALLGLLCSVRMNRGLNLFPAARSISIIDPDYARSSGWESGIAGIAAFEGPWASWERGLPARMDRPRAGSPRSQETGVPNLSLVRNQVID